MRRTLSLLSLLAVFLAAGCGAQVQQEAPCGPNSGCATAPAGGATETGKTDGLRVETIVKNLDTPWEVAFAPDGRIFVTERPGVVRVIEDGELREEPYADLGAEEMGRADSSASPSTRTSRRTTPSTPTSPPRPGTAR